MQLAFHNMQGAGNQILLVDQRYAASISPSADVLATIQNSAPDFDQLMWVEPAAGPEAAARYRVFNNDGSEVEQCGNGVRCLAIWLAGDGDGQTDFLLESPTGLIEARVTGKTRASVNMGPPAFNDELAQLDVAGAIIKVDVLSMGNPHCVIDVDDVSTADVANLGPAIENHASFPNRTNVGFMQFVDRTNIRLRVFERGAGETLACGTGACAAVASGHRRDLLDDEVTVQLPGGQLVVSWRGGSEAVWLTGDAELISKGIIDL